MIAAGRRRRLAAALADAGAAALVAYGNGWQNDYLRYVCDFGIVEGNGIAIAGAGGDVRLFLDSVVEAERAERECPGVATAFEADVVGAAAGALAGIDGPLLAAPRRLIPHGLAADERLSLGDGTALVDRLLMRKDAAELDALRRAAALADEAYAVFRDAAVAGAPQYALVAEVERFLRARGCPENFMLVGSGGVDVRGMTPPSDRRLASGDLVTTELTPAVDGYFAQICRTLVVGEANDAQRHAFALYLEALEAGIAAVRPGATAADVARAENEIFRKHDLGDYVTSSYTRVRGHGIGLFPDSKPHVLEDVDVVLEPGMALVVHPNTYHPAVGYVVLGDSVIVTERGCEVLTRTARTLFETAAG